jgi:acetyl-CoA carboxylase biotin carboxyl carrier protein
MGMINEETLRRIINLVEASQIDEIEISRWGTRVRITRRRARENSNGAAEHASGVADAAIAAPRPMAAPAAVEPSPAASALADGVVEVRSPMVGTYYASPAPGEPSFVNVNDRIAANQVLCIIEAMKLMNEIRAEVTGRLVKALVANGQPVEYNQPLFLIDTKG